MPATVKTIPATERWKQVSAALPCSGKRRVAAYARVSTGRKEQLTSYEAQVDYYTKYIQGRPDWEFAGIYSDEGISGTGTKNRDGFRRMVADALAGKIDLILTKSVSRFARNTVDSITTIRELKRHGTECYFEKENIWTFDGKGDLIHKYYDKKCTMPALKETDIQARFLKAANQMITDRDRIISVFREALAPTLSTRALEKERATLEQELSSTAEQIEAFLRENARRGVVQEQYQQDYAALTTHFEETKSRIKALTDTITEYKGRKLVIRNYLRELRKKELLTEFRDRDWQTMVDHMTVYSKDDIRITFKDGTEIKT